MSPQPSPSFSPEYAIGFRNMLLPAIAQEREITRNVIAAVPDTKHDYRPDPKSRGPMELATHIVESEVWFLNGIADQKFVWDPSNNLKPFASAKEVLAWYDQNFPKAYEKVNNLSAEQLLTVLDFFGMKVPAFSCLLFANNHSVHHRAQLSTYLRPMGSKVPDIYGGSADHPFEG